MENFYKICNEIIKLEYSSEFVGKIFQPFLTDYNGNDVFYVSVSESEIKSELNSLQDVCIPLAESTAILRKISQIFLKKCDAVLFHSSAIKYGGQAYLFTAPSGTGKSTHSKLLKDLLGDKIEYINDDKPFVKLEGDKFIVYGNPWAGKHNLGLNDSAPLKAIILLKRAQTCSLKKLDFNERIKVLLEQTVNAEDKDSAEKYLNLILKLATVDAYQLNCNKDIESAKFSYENVLSI